MPTWLQWINPAIWTSEWVSAVGSGVAATAAIVALIVTLRLAGRQSRSLQVTIAALTDEMEWRHQERERQLEEATERRAAQASKIRFAPVRLPDQHTMGSDFHLASQFLKRSGLTARELSRGFKVDNSSSAQINNVTVAQEHGHAPSCYVIGAQDRAGANSAPVIVPGESARFYWVGSVSDLQVYVDFTDAAGVHWRLHHRDGLSEVTGQE